MEEGDILRQRRNLVAMSCLLIIFDLAKVEVAKVGVLGTDLIIGDVRVLAISMWVVWAYFLLRYYQFWRADSPHLSRAIFDLVETYGRRHAINIGMAKDDLSGSVSLVRKGWLGGWRFEETQYVRNAPVVTDQRDVSWPVVLSWRLKSWWHVVVHTPHFTEHALPLVLAAATPVVAVLTKICAQP
ncbi:hypothetical protein CSC76_04635 [Pseudoxanthomonas mexicana]|uniref:hypothetical protein n=1 Tax=Pseudoxanthomonas mexicana TaxID=128785 RepID=UPI0013899280|nr:hypothetical protein [Pseudoxanthomonas mexicana]KAF1728668.1 hypothetical protein CSC76_04635 [Pseudoxanthomonas mexicana]